MRLTCFMCWHCRVNEDYRLVCGAPKNPISLDGKRSDVLEAMASGCQYFLKDTEYRRLRSPIGSTPMKENAKRRAALLAALKEDEHNEENDV